MTGEGGGELYHHLLLSQAEQKDINILQKQKLVFIPIAVPRSSRARTCRAHREWEAGPERENETTLYSLVYVKLYMHL